METFAALLATCEGNPPATSLICGNKDSNLSVVYYITSDTLQLYMSIC